MSVPFFKSDFTYVLMCNQIMFRFDYLDVKKCKQTSKFVKREKGTIPFCEHYDVPTIKAFLEGKYDDSIFVLFAVTFSRAAVTRQNCTTTNTTMYLF